ncbi:sulfur carrier protein ThiS [Desulforamulus hydrothermalis]|uniref:Sulfur transfer protein n=1 Tax=Desulforamulus hydrothermalis Lam5 = DSM 18033 TaxID=1121428 RepID=K8DZN0_9FIRM|nr:sulfur carrier protein ThiS [Desulforamulus hydrothermalis]CCO08574.1 Sulfur transfer protein [Desulforamulus hydrothermalis Lam5 = DSM 18033]SHH01918.1 sulfur carrier protein [Desulforamulus hydrothermalis Lam5 = DSM 18033]
MKIFLNGKELAVEPGSTVACLLNRRGLRPDSIIVEYNYRLVKQDEWATIILQEGDNIEVLRFVGGG